MYIQKDYGFWEIESLPNNYKQGSSINDYEDGAWIKLSKEQLIFKDKNRSASALEVFNMKLNKKKEVNKINKLPQMKSSSQGKMTFKDKIKSIIKDPYRVLKRKAKWILINWLNKL